MILTQSGRDFYNAAKDNYTHIISIVCPDEKELVTPIHKHHLILKMWDTNCQLQTKYRTYNPPSITDCLTALNFAKWEWYDSLEKNKPFNLLIHCDAGVSRSSAIALGVLWECSKCLFSEPTQTLIKPWLEARKQWCSEQVDDVNSVGLKRFIDGRYNPGIKPNTVILRIYRDYFKTNYFPW